MNKEQLQIVIGTILGDAFLQKTGKKNARLRLEHSIKQKDYIFWKYEILKNFMQDKPKVKERYNPIFKRTYCYYRCQSHSSPVFGKLQQVFYKNRQKIIPESFEKIINPLSLAVWYMDDGYYSKRDKRAYLYLSKFTEGGIKLILKTLKKKLNLRVDYQKKKRGDNLILSVEETKKLFRIIRPYIVESMKYKIS